MNETHEKNKKSLLFSLEENEKSKYSNKSQEDNISCILRGEQIVTKKSLGTYLSHRYKKQEKKLITALNSEKNEYKGDELLDDFNDEHYKKRLQEWIHYHTARWCYNIEEIKEIIDDVESLLTYLYTFSSQCSYTLIEETCRIPHDIWTLLFPHQQKALCFLWRMHQLNKGCIIADEMGLGKTIEIVAFLAALHFTMILKNEPKNILYNKQKVLNENFDNILNCQNKNTSFIFPFINALIVCPATVIQQWVHEFHEWYPFFRCFTTCKRILQERQKVIKKASCFGSILIVSYETLRHDFNMFQDISLSYVILDEGQKIRNPESGITIAVKKLKTQHRIILSGTPIQNDLKELWCLFDFVVPKRLGGLEHFSQTYVDPIRYGTLSNATPSSIAAAQKAAESLRCLIAPHFLRRTKKDVEANVLLPPITQQILLCHITPAQYQLYSEFIKAQHSFLARKGWSTSKSFQKGYIFFALSVLRKICNHPDILLYQQTNENFHDYGAIERSSKLRVTLDIVATWYAQNHRVLIFSQTIQTLNILEFHFSRLHYRYERVDGKTSLTQRHAILEKFNEDPTLFMLLLTTRVGGVGLNLTKANRILIFDLDWNPMIDEQAKERSWRIGQTKDVVVYCLVVAGTIEEKIYQRQITKHALSHRILVNPYKKRLFKMKDIYDLFQLPRFPPLYEKMNSLQDYTHSDNYRLFKEYETLWAQYNEDTINTISSSPMTLSKLSYTKQVLLKPSSLIPTSPITSCLDIQIPKRKRCKLQKEQQECSNSTFLNSFSNDSSSKETLNKYSFSVNSIIQKDEDLSDDVLVNHLLKHNKIQTAISHDLLMNPFEYWNVKKKRIKKQEKEENVSYYEINDMEHNGKDEIETNSNKINADKLAAQFFMDRFETTVLQKDSITDWKNLMHQKIKKFFQIQQRCTSDVLVNKFSQWIQRSPNSSICQMEFKKILKMYAFFDAQTNVWINNTQMNKK